MKDSNSHEEGRSFSPRFNNEGLIPVVVQEQESNKVLMLAYMNKEALDQTLDKGEAVFFSRSRQKLWHKGEESGNRLQIVTITVDCDQDTLLLRVQILGDKKACHTGRKTCFYRDLQDLHGKRDLVVREKI